MRMRPRHAGPRRATRPCRPRARIRSSKPRPCRAASRAPRAARCRTRVAIPAGRSPRPAGLGPGDGEPQPAVSKQAPERALIAGANAEHVAELVEYQRIEGDGSRVFDRAAALDQPGRQPCIEHEQRACADDHRSRTNAPPHARRDDARARGARRMSPASAGSTPTASAGKESVTRLIHRIWVARSGNTSASPAPATSAQIWVTSCSCISVRQYKTVFA